MGQEPADARAPESIDPTGFWRFVFWVTFVLGSLSLLLAWGLAHVPQPIYGGDFRPNYAACASVVAFMSISILMARWLWGIKNPIGGNAPASVMRIIVCLAWTETALGLLGILGIAVYHH